MRLSRLAVLSAALVISTSAIGAPNYVDPAAYQAPHTTRQVQSLAMPGGQVFDKRHSVQVGTVLLKFDPASPTISAAMPDTSLVMFTGMKCDGSFGKDYICKMPVMYAKGMKAPSCTIRVSQPTPPSTVVSIQQLTCPESATFAQ